MTLPSNPDPVTPKKCCSCGVAFHCGAASSTPECWCDDLPKLSPVAEHDCLCPACFEKAVAQQHVLRPPPLVAGVDYYAEGKLIIFTAQYHLRRGYCCERGCRHCPYR